MWAAGVAAAASEGAVVWRVRKGKRAVKSCFACTAVKGSAKAAAMGEAAAALAKGLQTAACRQVGEKGRAVGTENKDLHEPTALKTPATGATLEEAALLRPGLWAGSESSFACMGVSK